MPPPQQYREKPLVVLALQYTGSNKSEIIALGGPNITEKDGQLRLECILGSGQYQIINATDWVYTDPRQQVFCTNNSEFNLVYQPGGGPVAETQPA
jgi:hypothetical protein